MLPDADDCQHWSNQQSPYEADDKEPDHLVVEVPDP